MVPRLEPSMIDTTIRLTVTGALMAATLVWVSPARGQGGAPDGEWKFYAGDGGHTQYTGLDQIDRSNAGELQVAWRWQAENSADRPFYNFESTPIMIGGVLYTSTGETRWLFTPQPKAGAESDPARRPQRSGRGVACWTDGDQETIFHNVSDGRLLALDATTGLPRAGFGDGGYVDLSQNIDKPGAEVRCISTPIVSNDVAVAQVVPGEPLSPTQPIPSRPAPFDRQGFTIDDLIDFTPEIRAEAMEIAANYRMGPLYTPPSLINDPSGTKGTLVLPGWGGGSSWPGAGVDVEEGILFVPSLTIPVVVSLAPGEPGGTNPDYMRVGPIYPPGPRGLPLVKPPWGRITAIDLSTGDHLWSRPLGGAPREVREHPDLQGLGLDFSTMGQNGRPGALVTKTLLFMGEGGGVRSGVASLFGAGGPTFRAYDKRNGEVVAEIVLPANPTAAPMSYMVDGTQYITVAAATLESPAELIAIALS
jgi:glucose dehydrogenase